MNGTAILTDLAQRPLDVARTLEATPERLVAHAAGQDNSIAWLLWHAARQMDEQVCALSGAEPVWTAQGFEGRFGLDRAPRAMGYGDTPEQARAVVVKDLALLVEHLEAVVQAQISYLASLSDADLDDVVDDAWDPPVTRGARLVSVNADALEHVGQAAFLAGLGDAAFG